MKIHRVQLSKLVPDPANARTHDEKNLAAIRSSLTKFGQVEPLVVRKGSNVVIGGNGRLEAMRTLEWTEAAVKPGGSAARSKSRRSTSRSRWSDSPRWDWSRPVAVDAR